jgi:hypothetical protein
MTARKARAIAEFYVALVALVWPEGQERVTQVKPDPSVTARIRAYTARTMVERYGEWGPPS